MRLERSREKGRPLRAFRVTLVLAAASPTVTCLRPCHIHGGSGTRALMYSLPLATRSTFDFSVFWLIGGSHLSQGLPFQFTSQLQSSFSSCFFSPLFHPCQALFIAAYPLESVLIGDCAYEEVLSMPYTAAGYGDHCMEVTSAIDRHCAFFFFFLLRSFSADTMCLSALELISIGCS
jgi:hypothetical protein